MVTLNSGAYRDRLFSEALDDMLMRARTGDKLAAIEVIPHIAWLLSLNNLHPSTGEPLPVPLNVRQYMSEAFYMIAQGRDSNIALNLKKKGRHKWSRIDKILVGDLMYQLVDDAEMDVVDAAKKVSDTVGFKVRDLENEKKIDFSSWCNFKGKSISWETAKAFYYETHDEIKAARLATGEL